MMCLLNIYNNRSVCQTCSLFLGKGALDIAENVAADFDGDVEGISTGILLKILCCCKCAFPFQKR